MITDGQGLTGMAHADLEPELREQVAAAVARS